MNQTFEASGNSLKDSDPDRPWSEVERPISTANRARQRLALFITIVVITSMILLGWRLHAGLQEHAFDGYARNDAYLAQTIIGPILDGAEIPFDDDRRRRLDEAIKLPSFTRDVAVAKIWHPDGRIAYSTDRSQIGRIVESPSVKRASQGETVAKFDDVDDPDGQMQETNQLPLVEVYSPIRSRDNEIIYVAEFYRDGRELKARIAGDLQLIWGSVITATALILSLLFVFGARARNVIYDQQQEIRLRMRSLQQLSTRNRMLKKEAEVERADAFRRGQEFLSMLGSHLHDGPVQLLSLLVLKLSSRPITSDALDDSNHSVALLQSALSEIRLLAHGLVLPELKGLNGEQVVRLAVKRHSEHTGTSVALSINGDIPAELDEALKICLYRVVQESLNNSFKHAAGVGQAVCIQAQPDRVFVMIQDSGGNATQETSQHNGLGLIGLHRLVRSVSGDIEISNTLGCMIVKVKLPITLSTSEELTEVSSETAR
jgi:signal transduction histidine kinase